MATVSGNLMSALETAQTIGQIMCQKISSCSPIGSPSSPSNCYSSLQIQTNIVQALGVQPAIYPLFGDLVTANSAGVISGNVVVGNM